MRRAVVVVLIATMPVPLATATSAPVGRASTSAGTRTGIAAALAQQVAQCWLPPTRAQAAEPAVVSFRIALNRDGSIAQPPQLSASQGLSDPFVLEAAEAGRRAIATCAPYKLPADRYDQWRDIVLTFDPRQMVGQ